MSILANPSIDALLASVATNGSWPISLIHNAAATTAATATCGGISCQRLSPSAGTSAGVVVPTPGGALTRVFFPNVGGYTQAQNCGLAVVLEYKLGSLNLATNVFTAGVTMPSKTVRGTIVQTASEFAFMAFDNTPTGWTTPTVTVTYTDQDGTAAQTAALTLPSNPLISSAFLINPHLATGDCGIRAVTGISRSAVATTGSLQIYGCLVLGMIHNPGSSFAVGAALPTLSRIAPLWYAEPGAQTETINIYRIGTAGASISLVHLTGVGD